MGESMLNTWQTQRADASNHNIRMKKKNSYPIYLSSFLDSDPDRGLYQSQQGEEGATLYGKSVGKNSQIHSRQWYNPQQDPNKEERR